LAVGPSQHLVGESGQVANDERSGAQRASVLQSRQGRAMTYGDGKGKGKGSRYRMGMTRDEGAWWECSEGGMQKREMLTNRSLSM
jgi:hypothetical protein